MPVPVEDEATVLVVEPSRTVSSLVVATLGQFGLTSVTAGSAAQAAAVLDETRPRLVIASYVLPDTNGISFIAEVKKSPDYARVPAVLVSSDAGAHEDSDETGPDLYIQKTQGAIRDDLSDYLGLVGLGTPTDWNESRLNNSSILVVDDDRVHQVVLKRTLETVGATVAVAGDGQAAVQKVLEGNYRLLLIDIEMPVMNGWQAIERIRALGITTPTIAVTGHRHPSMVHQSREAGFNGLLAKPVDRNALLACCARHVSLE